MQCILLVFVFVTAITALSYKQSEHIERSLEIDNNLNVEKLWKNFKSAAARNGCSFKVNGDLGQPQPVYLHGDDYLKPTGNTGLIKLDVGEQIRIACTGSGRTIKHPNIASNVATATATCVNNDLVSGAGWLNGNGAFRNLTCSSNSFYESEATEDICFNNNRVIRVGFRVDNVFYPLYWSCFDQSRLEVLYVWYEQNPTNMEHQTNVDRPSSWQAGSFFPGVDVDNRYTQVQQKISIANVVGQALADKYVTSSQFLTRGHLSAKSDYVFATGQRATFYFINAAPQWQTINAGNWNTLEQSLRQRIGTFGYNTIIYTGTFGVTQLRNANDSFVDIYLHYDANNNPQIPVPQYFYKVVYDESWRLGTAFVSINNPHYTLAEARSFAFCTDHCRNNPAFRWLNWQPDRVDLGYSFCCTIPEFRRVVPHLPEFSLMGLLT